MLNKTTKLRREAAAIQLVEIRSKINTCNKKITAL